MALRVAVIALVSLSTMLAAAQDSGDTHYLRSISVEKGDVVADDVICIACSARIAGEAQGDVIVIGGDVEVTGTVQGDAMALGGRIRVRPGGVIDGDTTTIGGETEISPRGRVAGDRDAIPYFHVPGQRSHHLPAVLAFLGGNVLLIFLGGLIFRRRTECAAAPLRSRPVWTLAAGIGLAALWIGLLVLPSFKSRWLSVAEWIGHIVLTIIFYCGCVALAWWIGSLLTRKSRIGVNCLIGGAILTIAMLLPVAGGLVFLALVAVSLGTAALSGFGQPPGWSHRLLHRKPAPAQ